MLLLVLFIVGAFSGDCSMAANTMGGGDIATVLSNHHYTNCQEIKDQSNCDLMNWINSHITGTAACTTCCAGEPNDRRQCIRKYTDADHCADDARDLTVDQKDGSPVVEGEGLPLIVLVEDICELSGASHPVTGNPMYKNQMWNKMACIDSNCQNCPGMGPDMNGSDGGSHDYDQCYQKPGVGFIRKVDCNPPATDPPATNNDFACVDKLPSGLCAGVMMGSSDLPPALQGGCSGVAGRNKCNLTCGHCEADRRRRL